MSYQDIRNTREGLVRSDIGDKLIKIESQIVGIVAFITLLCIHKGFKISLVCWAGISFILPWLVGLIPYFAWIMTIAFSIIWSIIGYFVGGALFGDSIIIGSLVAITIFLISVFAHRVFAGLGFASTEKIKLDSLRGIRENIIHMNKEQQLKNEEKQKFCPECGEKIEEGTKFCGNCGKAL